MNILKPLFIVTPVLLALAAGIIAFVFKYQRRMLQHQEHLRQIQEARQRQLLDATMQAQEDERRRVAQDLHDEVGAMLALVKLNVHQLTTESENKAGGQKVKQLLDDVMGSVRHISHDLLPVVLDKMGLGQALAALQQHIPASSGVKLVFNCQEPDTRFSAKAELFLYRVVQELLNNTLKHARATTITINLSTNETDLQLEYQDNGIGFDYQGMQGQSLGNAGLGLMNMQARIELLNGRLHFFSSPETGTKAEILVPIK